MKNTIATLRDNDSNLKGHKLNLQLFAEGEPAEPKEPGEPKEPVEPKEPNEPKGPKEPEKDKTYTQEELDKLLQSEADKRVTKALETAKDKWEKEYKEKLKAEKEEAEKLAKMSADEKRQHELDKIQKQLVEKENAIKYREMKLEAINILNEKELPITFVDMMIKEDAETTKKNIETFEDEFRKEVQKAVEDRLKGPKPGKGNKDTEVTLGLDIAKSRNEKIEPKLNPWG